MARVKAKAPSSFAREVNDTEKRVNLLFDHLNNGDLLKADTIQSMVEISRCIQSRDMGRAGELLTELMRTKLDTEGGNWMVSLMAPLPHDDLLTYNIGWCQALDCNE